jgi:RND family efflux transporter MFP subunit
MITIGKKISNLVWAAASMLYVILAGCQTAVQNPSEKRILIPVRTAQALQKSSTIPIAASVIAADIATISSRYSTTVFDIKVKAGDKVKKGELLVRLDDRAMVAENSRAFAARDELEITIDVARDRQLAAQNEAKLASSTYEKYQMLFEKNAVSKLAYEEAETRKNVADANLAAAKKYISQLEQKRIEVKSAMVEVASNLDYLQITAPFDGTISAVSIDPGAIVNPGQPLISIERTGQYKIVFHAEENLLEFLKTGNTINVLVPALQQSPFSAVIDEISPSIETGTRTVQIQALLSARTGLKTGLSARVLIPDRSVQSVWIPREFLAKRDDLQTVMVNVEKEWHRALVKTGKEEGNEVEILAGLNAGETIGLFGGFQ